MKNELLQILKNGEYEKLIEEKYQEKWDKKNERWIRIWYIGFRHRGLMRLSNTLKKEYVQNGAKGRITLTYEQIFDVMYDILTEEIDPDKFKSDGQVINYIKKVSHYRLRDLYNKENEYLIKEDLWICSLDAIVQTEQKEQEERENNFDNLTKKDFLNESELIVEDNNFIIEKPQYYSDEDRYDSFNNLFYSLGCYEKNEKKDSIKAIHEYKSFMTRSQLEKFNLLLLAIENGEEITDRNCNLIKKNVKKILFPDRKGNANKDIDQYIESVNARFDNYYKNVWKKGKDTKTIAI